MEPLARPAEMEASTSPIGHCVQLCGMALVLRAFDWTVAEFIPETTIPAPNCVGIPAVVLFVASAPLPIEPWAYHGRDPMARPIKKCVVGPLQRELAVMEAPLKSGAPAERPCSGSKA